MSFVNELIDGSGAVSNACQSWHLWGMSVDFVVTWLKKKKKMAVNAIIISQYFYQIVLKLGCLTYLPKMNLFPWTVFLPEGFENGIIQRFLTGDYMSWGSISLFAGFLEKENSLETLIGIFENVSPKGFFLTEYGGFRNFRFDGKFSIFTDSRS